MDVKINEAKICIFLYLLHLCWEAAELLIAALLQFRITALLYVHVHEIESVFMVIKVVNVKDFSLLNKGCVTALVVYEGD